MSADLASEVKSFATRELGFDLVGITTAEPLPGGKRLARWIDRGAHGDMSYMATTLAVRADPRAFLPGARSVVCVAMSYRDAPEPPETGAAGERAVVARYARRRDYHKVLRGRLVRLGRLLADRVPGAAWRPAVDTAPLLEKELAQRAGLGWIGKNTCLINRTLGSELLLGELVTSVALPPDEAETDHCGTCTLCLEACPTRAFDGAKSLDARRCISYATIEHRGAFPESVLPGLGGHVFGCDICQAVCPWNRRAPVSCNPALATRAGLRELSRTRLAALDDAGWTAVSAGTPLRRLDGARLRRNLDAIAVGARRRLE
ncbi:MAG TPA: tRNA epoxyqueuosine(34) reductase QueG [Thermoanaerobaculaceae bacterium]|nr:tRNA epoxyqueuosine(34) reductase QueG [Thermoanaerobaculaceae bacterium]